LINPVPFISFSLFSGKTSKLLFTNIPLLCSFMIYTQFTGYKYFAALQLFQAAEPRKYL